MTRRFVESWARYCQDRDFAFEWGVGRAHLPVRVLLVVGFAFGYVCLVRLVGLLCRRVPLRVGFAGLLGRWGLGVVTFALHFGESELMTSLEVNSSGGWRIAVGAEVDRVASAGTATRQLVGEVPRTKLMS